jgi:hypothetical protein
MFQCKQEMQKYETEEYKGYLNDVDNYLNELAGTLSKSKYVNYMDPENLKNAREYVDILFAHFFLSADERLIDLANTLGVKNILEF